MLHDMLLLFSGALILISALTLVASLFPFSTLEKKMLRVTAVAGLGFALLFRLLH